MDDYNQDEYWSGGDGVVDASAEEVLQLWQWLFQEFG